MLEYTPHSAHLICSYASHKHASYIHHVRSYAHLICHKCAAVFTCVPDLHTSYACLSTPHMHSAHICTLFAHIHTMFAHMHTMFAHLHTSSAHMHTSYAHLIHTHIHTHTHAHLIHGRLVVRLWVEVKSFQGPGVQLTFLWPEITLNVQGLPEPFIYTPFMTMYLVISLPKIPYTFTSCV